MATQFTAKNVTFRVHVAYADIIAEAAKAADQTPSEWCRDRVPEIAAKELGIKLPPLPELKRGKTNELIQRAAELTGLSPEEFMRQAGERMAAVALGFVVPTAPATSRASEIKDRTTPAQRRRRSG